MNVIREPPERDVHVLNRHFPMITEVPSTASSDISESLREQILGKAYFRRNKPIPRAKTSDTSQNQSFYSANSNAVVPNQEIGSSFEIISVSRSSGGDLDSLEENNTNNRRNSKKTDSRSSGGDLDSLQENNTSSRNSKGADNLSEEMDSLKSVPSKKSTPNSTKDSNNSKTESTRSVRSMTIGSQNSKDTTSLVSKKNSLSSEEQRRCITIETQTIGIQTAPISEDINCGCTWGDCMCNDHKCNCSKHDKKVNIPDEPSESTLANFTDCSSQTFVFAEDNHYICNCSRPKWVDYETQSTTEDHFSDDSEDSYGTDFFDLPYQNNEDYLKLLRELEHKLIARNRERVRKTMLEFERRSRQNQNLEKPIWDYNSDNASLLRRFKCSQNRRGPVCCKCGRCKRIGSDSINSDILQNEKRWDEIKTVRSPEMSPLQSGKGSKVERSLHKSHWQLDPRSGEWIKVSCFQQTDFARHPPPPHGDYHKDGHKKIPPPPPLSNMYKKECHCRQKKRPK